MRWALVPWLAMLPACGARSELRGVPFEDASAVDGGDAGCPVRVLASFDADMSCAVLTHQERVVGPYADGDFIYWVRNQFGSTCTHVGTIERVAKTGGAPSVLATVPTIGAPAFDANFMYWFANATPEHWAGYTLVRAAKDGTNQVALQKIFGAIENVATDGTALYFTTDADTWVSVPTTTRASFDGTNVTPLASFETNGLKFGIDWSPNEFALDDTAVYGTNLRVPKDGSAATQLFPAALPSSLYAGVALAKGNVYAMRMQVGVTWPSDEPVDAAIVEMPATAGPMQVVVDGFQAPGSGGLVAIDGDELYYPTAIGLARTNINGTATTIIGPLDGCTGIAFDATNVYWTSLSATGTATVYATCK